jgi:hypothetical protein
MVYLDDAAPARNGAQHVTANQPAGKDSRWQLPGALVSVGAALVLAAE